jgi:hypothetical protein
VAEPSNGELGACAEAAPEFEPEPAPLPPLVTELTSSLYRSHVLYNPIISCATVAIKGIETFNPARKATASCVWVDFFCAEGGDVVEA